MKQQLLTLVILTGFLSGCSTKPKNQETTASGESVQTETTEMGIAGSDTGSINGLYSVNFDFDKSTLSERELKKLNSNAKWLQKNPNSKLTIEGHTDQAGSSEYNLSLGERRAVFTKRQLVKLGVNPERLTTVSFGEEKPIANGDGESDMAKNRRANFVPR